MWQYYKIGDSHDWIDIKLNFNIIFADKAGA